jgi:hypothetical protein
MFPISILDENILVKSGFVSGVKGKQNTQIVEMHMKPKIKADKGVKTIKQTKKQLGGSRSHFTTDGQSVCLGIEHPCGTCDQILLPVGMLWSCFCGRPL